jgi:hypothetical protein
MDALMKEMADECKEKCKALKDKKRKHHEEEADSEFRESLAKRLQLPPKKKDPGSHHYLSDWGSRSQRTV